MIALGIEAGGFDAAIVPPVHARGQIGRNLEVRGYGG